MRRRIIIAMAILLVLIAACSKKAALPTMSESTLNSDARLAFVNVFTKCGHKTYEYSPAGEMSGYTRTELQNSSKSLRVVSFSPQEANIERYIDGYCPDHYLLKAKGKVLSIFKTDINTLSLVEKMRVSFDLSKLEKDARDILEKGMIFGSLQEIEQYIEDMDS